MPDNLYEAMFVVDAAKGGSDFPETVRHIAGLLTRNGATIQRMERWDERKLAYPIGRSKRGIYILVYFASDGAAVSEIRRATDLSEDVLRVLVLRVEKPSPVRGQLFNPEGEPVEPEPPAAEPEQEAVAPPVEGEPQAAEEGETPAAEPEQEAVTPPVEGEPQAAEEGETAEAEEAQETKDET